MAEMRPEDCIAHGYLFAINHSGGKDSQAMMIRLLERVPREQIIVVHAALGKVEWHGALEHAQAQAQAAGVPFIVASATKSFFEMVEHRFAVRPDSPCWPSAANRQCTSDLKRGPIQREVRRYAKAHGHTKIVNCMGIRAGESCFRAKAEPWKRNPRQSVAGRDWHEWLPIHGLSTEEVFATIRAAGQEPHPAYASGNERLSCVFCIMGSARDIANGARNRPELFAQYLEVEERTGYTMHMSRKPLGLIVEEAMRPASSNGPKNEKVRAGNLCPRAADFQEHSRLNVTSGGLKAAGRDQVQGHGAARRPETKAVADLRRPATADLSN